MILFIRDNPIISSDRMLHKDRDQIVQFQEEISGFEPQRDWRQDEMSGCKPPVVN
jgi:hypothetical protein